jgi:hypothetical protein
MQKLKKNKVSKLFFEKKTALNSGAVFFINNNYLGASLLRRVGLSAHSPRFAAGYPLPSLARGANSRPLHYRYIAHLWFGLFNQIILLMNKIVNFTKK